MRHRFPHRKPRDLYPELVQRLQQELAAQAANERRAADRRAAIEHAAAAPRVAASAPPAVPEQPASSIPQPAPSPEPQAVQHLAKKQLRSKAVTRAKARLRASKSPSASRTQDEPESSFDRHRRKCHVCNHPDREAIEELFINWHSPRAICAEFGMRSRVDWSSIYRHARATDLYARRCKNLRAVLDVVLEQAAGIAPTAQGIVSVVRAYTCLTDTHEWVEPERRVHIVNHIYRHDMPAVSNTPAPEASGAPSGVRSGSFASQAFVGADRFHRPAPSQMSNDVSSDPRTNVAHSSFRALHPRDVGGSASLPVSAEIENSSPHAGSSLDACHSSLPSNRHNPEITIASNSHITNDGSISDRHILHSVSAPTEKEK